MNMNNEKGQNEDLIYDIYETVGGIEITIDAGERDLMICKIVEEGKPDKLAIVRDLFGDGYLDKNEIRIDDNYYNEKEAVQKLNELSKELDLEIYEI